MDLIDYPLEVQCNWVNRLTLPQIAALATTSSTIAEVVRGCVTHLSTPKLQSVTLDTLRALSFVNRLTNVYLELSVAELGRPIPGYVDRVVISQVTPANATTVIAWLVQQPQHTPRIVVTADLATTISLLQAYQAVVVATTNARLPVTPTTPTVPILRIYNPDFILVALPFHVDPDDIGDEDRVQPLSIYVLADYIGRPITEAEALAAPGTYMVTAPIVGSEGLIAPHGYVTTSAYIKVENVLHQAGYYVRGLAVLHPEWQYSLQQNYSWGLSNPSSPPSSNNPELKACLPIQANQLAYATQCNLVGNVVPDFYLSMMLTLNSPAVLPYVIRSKGKLCIPRNHAFAQLFMQWFPDYNYPELIPLVDLSHRFIKQTLADLFLVDQPVNLPIAIYDTYQLADDEQQPFYSLVDGQQHII